MKSKTSSNYSQSRSHSPTSQGTERTFSQSHHGNERLAALSDRTLSEVISLGYHPLNPKTLIQPEVEITFGSHIEESSAEPWVILTAIRQQNYELFREQWQKFVFRPTDPFKTKWDILIMVFSLFNCFSVPIKVSFNPEGMDSSFFSILNAFVDMFFFIDILLSF